MDEEINEQDEEKLKLEIASITQQMEYEIETIKKKYQRNFDLLLAKYGFYK